MPTYSRRQLRLLLGQNHLRDTRTGITSWSAASSAPIVMDQAHGDLALSGQNAYQGAWLRHAASMSDARVATFNVGSGAYVSQSQAGGLPPPSGTAFEIAEMLPPADKDRALDEAVKALRARREVTIDSVADLAGYPVPDGVEQVLDAYFFASPTATLDRVRRAFRTADVVVTATGNELRVAPAIGGSQQVVLDAIVTLTLGGAETATVNVPDERLVLYQAEALCWNLMVRKAPRGTADEYRKLRDEATRQYNALARNFKLPVDRPISLGEDF